MLKIQKAVSYFKGAWQVASVLSSKKSTHALPLHTAVAPCACIAGLRVLVGWLINSVALIEKWRASSSRISGVQRGATTTSAMPSVERSSSEVPV